MTADFCYLTASQHVAAATLLLPKIIPRQTIAHRDRNAALKRLTVLFKCTSRQSVISTQWSFVDVPTPDIWHLTSVQRQPFYSLPVVEVSTRFNSKARYTLPVFMALVHGWRCDLVPFSSDRQHLSYDGCLEAARLCQLSGGNCWHAGWFNLKLYCCTFIFLSTQFSRRAFIFFFLFCKSTFLSSRTEYGKMVHY